MGATVAVVVVVAVVVEPALTVAATAGRRLLLCWHWGTAPAHLEPPTSAVLRLRETPSLPPVAAAFVDAEAVGSPAAARQSPAGAGPAQQQQQRRRRRRRQTAARHGEGRTEAAADAAAEVGAAVAALVGDTPALAVGQAPRHSTETVCPGALRRALRAAGAWRSIHRHWELRRHRQEEERQRQEQLRRRRCWRPRPSSAPRAWSLASVLSWRAAGRVVRRSHLGSGTARSGASSLSWVSQVGGWCFASFFSSDGSHCSCFSC